MRGKGGGGRERTWIRSGRTPTVVEVLHLGSGTRTVHSSENWTGGCMGSREWGRWVWDMVTGGFTSVCHVTPRLSWMILDIGINKKGNLLRLNLKLIDVVSNCYHALIINSYLIAPVNMSVLTNRWWRAVTETRTTHSGRHGVVPYESVGNHGWRRRRHGPTTIDTRYRISLYIDFLWCSNRKRVHVSQTSIRRVPTIPSRF